MLFGYVIIFRRQKNLYQRFSGAHILRAGWKCDHLSGYNGWQRCLWVWPIAGIRTPVPARQILPVLMNGQKNCARQAICIIMHGCGLPLSGFYSKSTLAVGAAFFMQWLRDGDPACNTLSWRWVAGLHSRGKHYLARAENIEKFTQTALLPMVN